MHYDPRWFFTLLILVGGTFVGMLGGAGGVSWVGWVLIIGGLWFTWGHPLRNIKSVTRVFSGGRRHHRRRK